MIMVGVVSTASRFNMFDPCYRMIWFCEGLIDCEIVIKYVFFIEKNYPDFYD